MNTQVSNICN
ncbi:hypothetical protein RDI58_019584 [Solanum bulbocastanum]|uniref:Uncharacterized protein n=1 Tax=Solanum bulbocastanum TaxID=147425 RepID=A0AAN8T4Q8_SOLBU